MMLDMIRTRWMTQARRAAVAGALGLAVLAAIAPGSARAQEDDEEKSSIWEVDKKILQGVMRGLGLRDGSEPQIDYRERSPLVIPPSRDLPQPQQAGTGQPPAWPADPDVKRRKEATKKRNKEPNYRGDDQQGQNLIPSELNPPGVTGSSGGTGSPTSTGNDERPISPSALGYFGGLFSNFGGPKEEVTTFDREPPRPNLTAPPSGYQTPSPAQPYGLTKKKDRATVKPSDPAVGAN